jgi:hypothetical protein
MVNIGSINRAGPVGGSTGGSNNRALSFGAISVPQQPVDTKGATNKRILSGLGIDLDTVLTPKGKRKKKAGLVGGDPEELVNQLGE